MVFELPPRGVKPRKRGLTTMIDFGPDEMGWTGGTGGIESLLECAAAYIDHAKIYALNGLLLPEEAVRNRRSCIAIMNAIRLRVGCCLTMPMQKTSWTALKPY